MEKAVSVPTQIFRHHRGTRATLVLLLASMLASLIAVPLGASPAAAAGPPRKSSIDVFYATAKIGTVVVQANGTGQVNAYGDRFVGGTSTIDLYEVDDITGNITRHVFISCASSTRQRCFTPILSDRGDRYYSYIAYGNFVWAGHGQRGVWTGYI